MYLFVDLMFIKNHCNTCIIQAVIMNVQTSLWPLQTEQKKKQKNLFIKYSYLAQSGFSNQW